MAERKPIKPLPYPVYFGVVALLTVVGLLNAVYLSISHYRVYTDIAYKSFCAISRAINCDTVSQSPYSIFWGIPVPIWGVVGYIFFLLLLPFAFGKTTDRQRIWSLLMLVSLVYCLCSLALAVVMTTFIHSYCIMCILSHGINFSLLFFTWLTQKRFKRDPFISAIRQDIEFLERRKCKTLGVFLPFVFLVAVTSFLLPAYWDFSPPSHLTELPTGITEDGHPWIGAENPELVITEFTDYLCFQCKKMHYYLREIVSDNPTKIRLIHRNFPMDHEYNYIVKDPFHVGSGKMALVAIYAVTKDKFWEMNDLLFTIAGNRSEVDVKELAKESGLSARGLVNALYDPMIRHRLKLDIWEGLKLRIIGTPSYLISGEVHQGLSPPEILAFVRK